MVRMTSSIPTLNRGEAMSVNGCAYAVQILALAGVIMMSSGDYNIWMTSDYRVRTLIEDNAKSGECKNSVNLPQKLLRFWQVNVPHFLFKLI